MAKKVIQMYDKYKSTTKIYPKVIKECFQDDAQEYIEGQVVANPTLAGTEASLTSLEVGGTKYKVEQPINVVANPTLAGTEADLEGLQVGDTKYKVGGGKQLYQHLIHYNYNGSYGEHELDIVIINDDSTPFTYSTFQTWLETKGYTSSNYYTANGMCYRSGSASETGSVYGVNKGATNIQMFILTSAGTGVVALSTSTTASSFVDTVITL